MITRIDALIRMSYEDWGDVKNDLEKESTLQASPSAPWTVPHEGEGQRAGLNEGRYHPAHFEDDPGQTDYWGSVSSSRALGDTLDQNGEGLKKQAADFY